MLQEPPSLRATTNGLGRPAGRAASAVMDSSALQMRSFVALAAYNIGHILTLSDAGRVMRRLAVNGTIPVMKNYEVWYTQRAAARATKCTHSQQWPPPRSRHDACPVQTFIRGPLERCVPVVCKIMR